ncbi:hypothetical protein ACHOLT_17445 [Desulfitobacterium sp. Sab5]|uniref:hypothetical protein n=1 Tax=Desulfitobacterium nosdiversum TaxID=3375356 RepID=UPI003CEA177D
MQRSRGGGRNPKSGGPGATRFQTKACPVLTLGYSSARVIRELHDYLSFLPGKNKNTATVIVVMAVLRRNLDSISEVKEAVVLHGLVSHLYGGLFSLMQLNIAK